MVDPAFYTDLKVERHDPCGNPVEIWTDQDGGTQEVHQGNCLTAEGEIKAAPETVKKPGKTAETPETPPATPPSAQEPADESPVPPRHRGR